MGKEKEEEDKEELGNILKRLSVMASMSASRRDKTLFGRVYLKSDSVRNIVSKPIRLRVVEVTSYWAEQSVEQHARDEDSGRKQVAAMVTTDQWKRKGICYLFIQYIHTWTVNWYVLLYYVVAVTPERLAQNRREEAR